MFRKYAKNKLRLGVEVKACKDCRGPERPCLVDGKPATFHRWVEEDKALLRIDAFMKNDAREAIFHRFKKDGFCGPEGTIEKLRTVKALVEWPDGSVSTVALELITFLDRREG
jgi:hypothetical protein